MRSFLFGILILSFSLNSFSKSIVVDSQPEIIFKYDKLKKDQEKFKLQVEFNKAVLLLQKGEYKKAIKIFKQTSSLLKIPSFLNIGIAYYKLGLMDNSLLYLNNIYNYKEAIFSNTYSYISTCFYLYQIKKEKIYLEKIIEVSKKFKNLTEHSKRMLADTYIILKDYKRSLKILNSMDNPADLKRAMLYMKLKDYFNAEKYLTKAKENTFNQKKIDQIVWLMIFRDLKSNQLEKLKDHLDELKKRKGTFKTNISYPLRIFFNKHKYTTKEYLNFITKFDENRKEEFMYYFAPFIFSDKQEILYDFSKGFIFKDKQNVKSLEQMISYNSKFINILKKDPIVRTIELKNYIKEDSNSYVYYNLALCYAQINDFHNAYKYFSKAYKLNPGNKLYSAITLITANRIGKKLKDSSYIEDNIKSKDGMYKYFGQMLYKLFINENFKVAFDALNYRKTIFYNALDYLAKLNKDEITLSHPLFTEYYKDPLIYLMKSTIRKEKENDLQYFSRLQDNTPLKINNNFLQGSLIITQYYIDLLKAIGLFNRADLDLKVDISPSYLRTKALRELHNNNPNKSLEILEELKQKYNLEDKYTMYLIVASLLEAHKYNEASLQISLIKAIFNDPEADFLTGVQLIQELKLNSAFQYFKRPYRDSLIDFKLLNFDKLLESL